MPKLFGYTVTDDMLAANPQYHKPAKKRRSKRSRNAAEATQTPLERRFDDLWVLVGGNPDFWQKQALFDEAAKWHVDRYNAACRVAVEIDGGQYMAKSGHNNSKGIERDAKKLNRCNELGILLFRLTTSMLETVDDVELILRVVKERTYGRS